MTSVVGQVDSVTRMTSSIDDNPCDTFKRPSWRNVDIPRSMHMGLERTATGWRLIDPIDYPVRTEFLVSLLKAVTSAQARAVPPSELEGVEQGFDPPRAVLELTEREGRSARRVAAMVWPPL